MNAYIFLDVEIAHEDAGDSYEWAAQEVERVYGRANHKPRLRKPDRQFEVEMEQLAVSNSYAHPRHGFIL